MTDGRIVVLNGGSQELLFWGPDGEFRYAVAGPGRGPGEFVNPTWLGHSADTLFVWDTGQMRLSVFDEAGALLTSHQVQVDNGDDVPQSIGGRFDDGSFFVRPGQLVFFGDQTGVVRFPQTYGRYDLETRRLDRLVNGRGPETVVGEGAIYELPFGKTHMAVAHGSVVVAGDNGTTAIRYYDTKGRLVRVVKWLSPPIAVTTRDEAAFHQYAAKTFPAFARPPRTARFARERPRFSAIKSDPSGWIWVRPFAADWESPAEWLVFDDIGMLRCSVEVPARKVLGIGEGHILGLQRNEFGEETVQVFALARRLP
jgi:hypothetical protein